MSCGARSRAGGAVAFVVVVMIVGCGNDDPKVGNGVDDVKASCQIRASWKRSGNECSVCEAAVTSPRCDCSRLRDFSAACKDQSDTREAACTESVKSCVRSCRTTDCACIVGCYAGGDACKNASDALDGCIAEACAPHCT